jgi:thiamine-phosphate pyrophosphorylase
MLRALDANANRLREGLRVAEDLARFVLEDPGSARRLKALRHRATASMRLLGLDKELLASRDSAGDPGRNSFPRAERERAALRELLAANLHRGQEAARVLEELGKPFSPRAAQSFKAIRYAIYDLEQALLA